MAELLSTQCPQCKTKLKLKSQAALGKSLPCPKCKRPFVVKPIEPEAPAVLSESDLAPEGPLPAADQDWLNQFSGKPLPPLASHAPLPKLSAAKKKSSSNWQKPALIAGGGVLGLVLLIGVIWMVVASLSGPVVAERPAVPVADVPQPPPRAGLDLAYLPPGAEIILCLRVADCFKAPVLQSLLAHPALQQELNHLRQNAAVDPADIQSVTIGIAGLSQQANELAQKQQVQVSGIALPWAQLGSLPLIIVVRTTSPIDQQKILNVAARPDGAPVEVKPLSHAGKSYHQVTLQNSRGPQTVALYFANDKTAVIGSEQGIQSAITRGDTPEVRPDLDFVDISQHLVLATTGNDAGAINLPASANPTDAPPDQGIELLKALRELTKAASFGIGLTDAIAFQMQFACADAAGADKLQSQLNAALPQQVAKYRQSMAQTKEQLQQLANFGQAPSPALIEAIDLLDAVLSTVQSQKQDGIVIVRASAPSSVGSTLAKLPEAMGGGFSQGSPAAAEPGQVSPGN